MCIGLIRVGINTTSHIMQHCVTRHFSQQCMAERATYCHFTVFWRHQGQTIVNFYGITPPFTFFSHCYHLHFGMCSYCKTFGVFLIIGESNYSFFLIYGQRHKILCSKSRDGWDKIYFLSRCAILDISVMPMSHTNV